MIKSYTDILTHYLVPTPLAENPSHRLGIFRRFSSGSQVNIRRTALKCKGLGCILILHPYAGQLHDDDNGLM